MPIELFPDLGGPIRKATNTFVDTLIVDYGHIFEAIANVILRVLVPLEQLLRSAPPYVILICIGAGNKDSHHPQL